MALQKRLVSVIVIGDNAPLNNINEHVTLVTNQTYKSVEILLAVAKGRDDLGKIKDRWVDVPNLRIVEVEQGVDMLNTPLGLVNGEWVFYKTIGPSLWFPRHIEHHIELFKWDQKAIWSFSHLEYKNLLEQQQPVNVLTWRIDKRPQPQSILLDELCHVSSFKPDWNKFLVSFDGGKTAAFFPGACLDAWRDMRVAIPEEITIQMWVDPRPPKPEFGKPASDQNVVEEVIEDKDGQLGVRVELPTLMGSSQWDAHNKLILSRIEEILPERIFKIALKRTIGMGDVILVEPVIRALRKRYPNAEITFYTSKSRSCTSVVEYFVSRPDITIGMDGEGELMNDFLYSQRGYDIRIDLDLAYESRRNVNYVDGYFQAAGFKDEVKDVDGMLQVVNPVPEEEKISYLTFEEPRLIAEKYVSVELAGSGWPGKEWDKNKWDVIIQKIIKLGYKVAFVSDSNPGFEAYSNKGNDFKTMMNYLRYAEFHIGADNGPMHVAAGLGKKCFVIAGAAIPAFTTKNPNVFQCVHPALQCLHCKGRQFFNQIDGGGYTFVARCENEDQYVCMKKLDEQYVLKQFESFYEKITT